VFGSSTTSRSSCCRRVLRCWGPRLPGPRRGACGQLAADEPWSVVVVAADLAAAARAAADLVVAVVDLDVVDLDDLAVADLHDLVDLDVVDLASRSRRAQSRRARPRCARPRCARPRVEPASVAEVAVAEVAVAEVDDRRRARAVAAGDPLLYVVRMCCGSRVLVPAVAVLALGGVLVLGAVLLVLGAVLLVRCRCRRRGQRERQRGSERVTSPTLRVPIGCGNPPRCRRCAGREPATRS